MSERLHIYVASPYTIGDPEQNRKDSIDYSEEIWEKGHYPFSPLAMTGDWERFHPKDYEDWMAYDFGWVARCDALFRGEGESSGADREVELAQKFGKTVFWFMDEIPDLGKVPHTEPVPREAHIDLHNGIGRQ